VDNPVVWAVVALVVVVGLFLVFRKKPEAEAEAPAPRAKAPEPKRQEKPAEPAPRKEAKRVSQPAPAPAPSEEDEEPEVAETEDAEPVPARARPTPPPRSADKPVSRREAPPARQRPRDVAGVRKGLAKARAEGGFFSRLRSLFTGKKEIDPGLVEQIEEVLLTSDVGVATTGILVKDLRDRLEKNELADEDRVWSALSERMTELLAIGGGGISVSSHPTVVLVVGVNGVGKTTTIGKLATRLKADGKKVVLAAGDTFRAAAGDQLAIWAKRTGAEIVRGKDGANPGSVVFDAVTKAKEIGADVVLCDTAGRLHTKTNLMDELGKVAKSAGKALEGAPHETLLVLDATTGQNALQQAAQFKEAIDLSGIVLTKMDGTAKGGVILGVCAEHRVPVRYVGMGEKADDLKEFAADEFVEALLGGREKDEGEAA